MGYIVLALAVMLLVLAYLAPTAAMAGSVCAYDACSIAMTLAAVCLVVGTLAAIVAFRGPADREGPTVKMAKAILVVAVLILGGMGALLAGFYGILLVAALFGALIHMGFTSRRAAVAEVFSTLASCMRQNLPLPGALQAAAAGRTGPEAQIFRRIAGRIGTGLSLSEAIRRGYPACPGEALGALSAAERACQAPQAMQNVMREMVASLRRREALAIFHPFYPFVLVFATLVLVMAMGLIVFPKYQRILLDFGMPMPAATQNLFSLTQWADPWWALGLALLTLAIPCAAIYLKLRPRRPWAPRPASVLGDALKWRLPVARWFERNHSLLRTVESLRLSLAGGRTIDQAVADALELDVNFFFRRRMRRWLAALEHGEDAAAAARRCGLGRSLAWAFDQQTNPGNAPAALEVIGEACRANYNYRARLARSILWPCLVVVMGCGVGYVAYALFIPLVRLIEFTAGQVIP
jgi:type II secretory pathway component PulF